MRLDSWVFPVIIEAMKKEVLRFLLFVCVVVFVASWLPQVFAGLSPAEISARLADGKALLVDVREAGEWKEGVAEPAKLLSLSDLKGARAHWTPFLNKVGGRELILVCRSGNRSGIAAKILKSEGYNAVNGGSYFSWKKAGYPVRIPD